MLRGKVATFSHSFCDGSGHNSYMLRILLVDDHAIVREGFKRLFTEADDFTVVSEAATVVAAMDAARTTRPDLAVLDLSLGNGGSGLTLLSLLHKEMPELRCVLLSMHDDPGLVLRALDLGAKGYVSKAVAPEELISLMRRVAAGETVFSSDLSQPPTSRARLVALTERERQTLHGLLLDKPPKAVAADMGISDKTLYRHRANLMEKLGARTPTELARIARELGLLLEF